MVALIGSRQVGKTTLATDIAKNYPQSTFYDLENPADLAQMFQLRIQPEEAFFWRTYTGAELDLFVIQGNKRLGFEFKRSTTPQLTKSLQIAAEDLKLTDAYVIHAGQNSFPLAKNVTALALNDVLTLKPI